MDKFNELKAFDAIASEVNETQRKVLFSQYSYKIKQNIMVKQREEIGKYNKEIKQLLLETKRMKDIYETNKRNKERLQEAVFLAEESNCNAKKTILVLQEKQNNVINISKQREKYFDQKWSEYLEIYESVPLAQERVSLKKEIKKISFQIDLAIQEERDTKEALKLWRDIKNKQDEITIVKFARFMVELPKDMERLKLTKDRVNLLREKLREERASQEEVVMKLPLQMKEPCLKWGNESIMRRRKPIPEDELPTLSQFSDAMKMDFPLLQQLMQQSQTDVQHRSMAKEASKIFTIQSSQNMSTPVHKAPKTSPLLERRTETFSWKADLQETLIAKQHSEPQEANEDVESTPEQPNHSKKIQVLENITVDQTQLEDIIQAVNPLNMKTVDVISISQVLEKQQNITPPVEQPREEETSESVPENKNEDQKALTPPTQFRGEEMEISLTDKVTQGTEVSTCQTQAEYEDDGKNMSVFSRSYGNLTLNETGLSCISQASSVGFSELRESILRKYRIDSSPTFEYTKIHKVSDETQSKFFSKDETAAAVTEETTADDKVTSQNSQKGSSQKESSQKSQLDQAVAAQSQPQLQYTTVEAINISGENQFDADFTQFIGSTSAVELSPTHDDKEVEELSGESNAFLLGLASSASKNMSDKEAAGKSGSEAIFNFNSPQKKKKRSSFFNLFN